VGLPWVRAAARGDGREVAGRGERRPGVGGGAPCSAPALLAAGGGAAPSSARLVAGGGEDRGAI
jgi:hypothetical protein